MSAPGARSTRPAPAGAGLDGLREERLAAQGLEPPSGTGVEQVVGRMLAVQAQEYLPAQFSLAQRIAPEVRPMAAEVAAAIDAGRILRTHLLRPTWHFVLPEDAAWLTQLSADRIRVAMRPNLRGAGLEAPQLARALDAVAAAVASGHRTRDELAAALEAAGLPGLRPALTTVLLLAEIEQLVVSGASRGAQRTYAAWDERVPPTVRPSRAEALARAAARFLPARGPATDRDLAAWASLSLRDARAGLADAVAAGLAETSEVDGERRYRAVGDAGVVGRAAPAGPARLLLVQAYDEYVMGYAPPRAHLRPLRPHEFADFPLHWLLADGVIAGKWGLTVGPRSATVRLIEVRTPRRGLRGRLAPRLAELADFLERPVTLDLEPDARGTTRRNR